MLTINRRRYPHVNMSRVERYLGVDAVHRVQRDMTGWYGDPILVGGLPSPVRIGADGEFSGRLREGSEMSVRDIARDKIAALYRAFEIASYRSARKVQLNALGSLNDVYAAFDAGEVQQPNIAKVGTTGVVGSTNSLWNVGTAPAAGATPGNAPGGTALDRTTTGAIPFHNPGGALITRFISAFMQGSVVAQNLLLYDRLWHVNKAMNSTATEAITGVPTRYQGTTPGLETYARSNFLFIETRTVLAATAHNWTVCTYTDQDGNTGATLPTVTGNSGTIVNRLDQPANTWFAPLAAGDSGILALTQVQCSAAVATGAISFVIGRPLAWIPCALANFINPTDGLRGAPQFSRIFDDACLALLEVNKSATTATTYTGSMNFVSG